MKPLRFMSRCRDFSLSILVAISILVVLSCEGDTIYQTDDGNSDSNPVPTLTSFSPTQATFGASSFSLTVSGSKFVHGSVVVWNGSERATQYVSATQVTATILASDLASQSQDRLLGTDAEAGEAALASLPDDTVLVWVRNPAPDGGTSKTLPFTRVRIRPQPYLDGINPSFGVVGGSDLEIDLYGVGFYPGCVARLSGTDIATTYHSDYHLSATIPASAMTAPDSVLITVHVGPPGGGTSNAAKFQIYPPNPVPTVVSFDPATRTAGSASFTLTVHGTDFVPGCKINWNGNELTTTYLGPTSASAYLFDFAIRDGKTVNVSVTNPIPGGGTSNELPFMIENPVPSIITLTPGSAAAGLSATPITITGAGFVPSSVGRWDGAPRATSFDSATRILVTLTAADLSSPGQHAISVSNPTPAGGVSGNTTFTTYLSVAIKANDLIYDPVSGNLFVSVPSNGGAMGNSITAINPVTGAIGTSVFVGSEPTTLARSDDGQYLYVALDGAAAVRRYIIPTATPDIQFAVGTDPFFGALKAEDIVVIPGAPGTIAVSSYRAASPRHGGVFIYDNGVRRTNGTQDHTGSNRIEPSASPTRLYGYNNETTEYGFRQLTISADGVTETLKQQELFYYAWDMTYWGGKVFATNGAVIDPETFAHLGTLPVEGPLAIANGKVFVVDYYGKRLVAIDLNTYLQVGEISISAIGSPTYKRPVTVGTDGLAFIVNNSVIIVNNPLFGP